MNGRTPPVDWEADSPLNPVGYEVAAGGSRVAPASNYWSQLNTQNAEFRSQGLFVGSGVVEAGCKTIFSQRLKLSGMHWTVRGANAIIELRCHQLSSRWEEFWESRATG